MVPPSRLLLEGSTILAGSTIPGAADPETAETGRAAASGAAPLPGREPVSPRRARASSASGSAASSRPGSRQTAVHDGRALVLHVVEPGRRRDRARFGRDEAELQPDCLRAHLD